MGTWGKYRIKSGNKDQIIFFQFRYFSIIARCMDEKMKCVQFKFQ